MRLDGQVRLVTLASTIASNGIRALGQQSRDSMSLSQASLRLTIIGAVMMSLVTTHIAANDASFRLELAVMAIGAFGAIRPNGYAGLFGVVAIALHWAVAVETPSSPWSIGIACCLALFHTSIAAASVVPLGAGLHPEMAKVWVPRLALVAALAVPTWIVVSLLNRLDPAPTPALFVLSLVSLCLVSLWFHSRSLNHED